MAWSTSASEIGSGVVALQVALLAERRDAQEARDKLLAIQLQEEAWTTAVAHGLPPRRGLAVSSRPNSLPVPARAEERALMEERLAAFGVRELEVAGDGNCQFRALSQQLCGDAGQHRRVRADVVRKLKGSEHKYRSFVEGSFGDYMRRMASDGCWGDAVTLQAAADAYGAEINLITSYPDPATCMLTVQPDGPVTRRIWLVFWAEVHYNAVAVHQNF